MYELINSVVDNGMTLHFRKINLDFSRLNWIDSTGVTILSNLIELTRRLGGDVRLIGFEHKNDAIKYLDDSLFFHRYAGGALRKNAAPRSTTAQLNLVSHAQSFSWIENDLSPWILHRTGIGRSSLAAIKVCFQEVFNNIKDHSTVDVGCIFGQHYPTKNTLQITISDFGIGIPANVLKVEPNLTDGKAIELATKEGFTTRTGRNNRGAGLDVLIKSVVISNGGTLILHSGAGILSCTPSGKSVKKTPRTAPGHYPGTLLQVTFRTDRFEIEEDEEEFEWSS